MAVKSCKQIQCNTSHSVPDFDCDFTLAHSPLTRTHRHTNSLCVTVTIVTTDCHVTGVHHPTPKSGLAASIAPFFSLSSHQPNHHPPLVHCAIRHWPRLLERKRTIHMSYKCLIVSSQFQIPLPTIATCTLVSTLYLDKARSSKCYSGTSGS